MALRSGMRSISRLLILYLSFVALVAGAQDVLPVPQLTARVIDQTATLDAAQRQALEQKLADFEQRKGTQMVFLLVPTTQPEDIAAYANRIGNTWKIGRKGVGDSVLLVVAKDDRKVRIEVAKTLEGAVPDLAAKQIIDDAITPRFRQGDFAGGLQAAADQLIARISGEPLPEPARRTQQGSEGFDWFDLAIFLFFAVPIVGAVLRGIFGRKLAALLTSGGVGALALLVTSSLVVAVIACLVALLFSLFSISLPPLGRRHHGRGGGPWTTGGWGGGGGGGGGVGGWGGRGGGFGSGGGGDFGGGGASGGW